MVIVKIKRRDGSEVDVEPINSLAEGQVYPLVHISGDNDVIVGYDLKHPFNRFWYPTKGIDSITISFGESEII